MTTNGTSHHAHQKTAGVGRLDAHAMSAIAPDNAGENTETPLSDRVRRAMVEDDLTQKTAAAQIGLNAAVLNQWLQGKYQGDVSKTEAKVLKWLRGRGERVSMQSLMPTAPEFFESETGTRIISHLKYAHSMQDMLTVFGLPGVGKTTSIHWYQRAYPNVWVATASPAITGVIPVLQEICEATQSGVKGNGGARARTQAILAKTKGTNGMLVVDEAHHLTPQALDTIRALHDASGIAIALFGGPELERKLQDMPQFYSRVGLKLFVAKVLKGDIDALLDAWGITKKEPRAFLVQLSTKPGALRGVTKVLKLASVVASSAGQELDIRHIKDAAATLAPQATGEE
jgi:DNA transposition AAA+ family ATPase